MKPKFNLRQAKTFEELRDMVADEMDILYANIAPPKTSSDVVVDGTVRGHRFKITVNDSDPTSPAVALTDLGTKG